MRRRITQYIVRVSEEPGFRDVRFYEKDGADRFAADAQEDGTYWGREERIIEPCPDCEDRTGPMSCETCGREA